MNRYQKEQISTAIDQLIKAQCIISEARGKDEQYQILAELQNCAIAVGTRIELLEGEGVTAVRLLENYCEILYELSGEKFCNGAIPDEVVEKLDNLLKRVQCIINDEITTRLEIVFLPYKASMWDSLESIWMAAKEDGRCSCRVIPIPYYEKNPDGSFGDMHVEDDEFPEYVPVTKYSEYDLSENRPDIIYFHNPYDKYNFVTSVHPSFYSSELKKCTDLLVYVPYFVTGDKLPEHFSETIGVFMADRVIVQSEAIKEVYMKSYIDMLGKEQKEKEAAGGTVNREFWDLLHSKADEKFLPLGSPKIDKVISNMKHKPELPAEWERIIRKRTGRQNCDDISDIKIILYNTSVSDLLTYRSQAVQKIKSVLNIFRNNKAAVLLWRPHPLNVATIKSMVPGVLNEYTEVIDEFRKEEYGIYDDSSDIHRAIALADAYYGDPHSSIVPMFGITGKPIMQQNIQLTETGLKGNKYAIGFEDVTFDGTFIWFSSVDNNGLFRMNVKTYATEYLGKFPDEQEDEKRLYISGSMYNNKLIYAPFKAKKGAIYDLKTLKFDSFVAVDDEKIIKDRSEKYACMIPYNDKVYMFPFFYPGIGCYSMKDKSVKYIDGWIKELKEKCKTVDDAIFRSYTVVNNRYVFLPFSCINAVLEFDLENEQTELFIVGDEGNSFSGICYDGKCFWLSPINEGPVIRWNKKYNEVSVFDEYPAEYDKGNYSILDTIYCAGYIWIFPLLANIVIKINPDTGYMETVPAFQTYFNQISGRKKKFHWVRTDGEKIYAYAVQENAIMSFDPANGEILKHYAVYPESMREEVARRYYKNVFKSMSEKTVNYFVYNERNLFCLEDYLDIIKLNIEQMGKKRSEAFKRLFKYNDGSCGKVIVNLIHANGNRNS